MPTASEIRKVSLIKCTEGKEEIVWVRSKNIFVFLKCIWIYTQTVDDFENGYKVEFVFKNFKVAL